MDVIDARAGNDRGSQEAAWMVIGSLVAGIVLYGGLGWLLGRWFGHQSLFMAGGVLFGLAAGFYIVYARLGFIERNGSEVNSG